MSENDDDMSWLDNVKFPLEPVPSRIKPSQEKPKKPKGSTPPVKNSVKPALNREEQEMRPPPPDTIENQAVDDDDTDDDGKPGPTPWLEPDPTPWQETVFERLAEDDLSGILWGDAVLAKDMPERTKTKDELLREVRLFAAGCFLQKNGKFIDVARPEIELSIHEVFRRLSQQIYRKFPQEVGTSLLSEKAIREIMEGVVDGLNADPRYAFGLFSGRRYLLPGNASPRLYINGYWDLNLWRRPSYRSVTPAPRDDENPLGAFGDFLNFAITDPQDRQVLLDWLAWSLQNEASKPSWAVFLFSEAKGTGKSTILEFARALFGEQNCSAQNGIDAIAGRFSEDILNKKLVTLEEVKLTSFSSAGNTLKEYITGTTTSIERKHQNDRVDLSLRACFLLTSNHKPTWLEGGERRYYIINVTHDGRSRGPEQLKFAKLVAAFKAQMRDPAQLNYLYLELIARELSKTFNPHVLRAQNALMQELVAEEVNETDAVLEDLFATYKIEMIPSERQYLLVRHLRLKGDQDLQSRLRRLGYEPTKRRFEGGQSRFWVRKNSRIENGRLYSPHLSACLPQAVEMGYVWWPLGYLYTAWLRLETVVLNPKIEQQPYSAIAQIDPKEILLDPFCTVSKLSEHTGPFPDSISQKPYTGAEVSLTEDLKALLPEEPFNLDEIPY